MSLNTIRHDALFDKTALTLPVHVIGCGGVGSHVLMMLAKLGVGVAGPVHVWDDDVVKPHNLPNQAFDTEDVGMSKALAIAERYRIWSNGVTPIPHTKRVDADTAKKEPFGGIVFVCLDSMTERKAVCDSLWHNTDVPLFIETRMDASTAIVHAINPSIDEHIDFWKSMWYPDDMTENDGGCNGPLSVITSVMFTVTITIQLFMRWAASRGEKKMPAQIQVDLHTWEIEVFYL